MLIAVYEIYFQESGSVLSDLENEFQNAEKEEATAASAYKAAKDSLSTHEKKARLLEKALADDKAALNDKKALLDQVCLHFYFITYV